MLYSCVQRVDEACTHWSMLLSSNPSILIIYIIRIPLNIFPACFLVFSCATYSTWFSVINQDLLSVEFPTRAGEALEAQRRSNITFPLL